MANTLESLFKELDNFISASEFENAIGICDKIFKIDPKDPDAFQCKLVALIKSGKFADGLKFLEEKKDFQKDFLFEKSYCLYREKQLDEALKVLKAIPEPRPPKALKLEAQLFYRKEDYAQTIRIYEQLLKDNQQKGDPELKTNLCAAYVAAGMVKEAEKMVASNKDILKECFEFAYNAAGVAIETGDWAVAEKNLDLAQKVANSFFQEDGLSEEEIKDEISVIRTQLAFVYQMQGKTNEAIEIYNAVLKDKPSDESVIAVASNNVVSLKQHHELFDSSKKLKNATSQTLDQKLTTNQKKIIGFNKCLLLLFMNKTDQCKDLLKQMQEQFPDTDRFALVSAAILYKEKKDAKAEELLKAFAAQNPQDSIRVQLSMAQLHLNRGDIKGAIASLESITSLKNKPAVVATLVSLYEQISDVEGAVRTLDSYIESLGSGQKKDEDLYIKILKKSANFKLKHKKYKEAAGVFEKVIQINANDLEALPGLIIAYSQCDPPLAEKYAKKIPSLAEEAPVDAEALEDLAAPSLSIRSKSTKTENTEIQKKEKKKKKRKPRLPKNYDPSKPIDPERWLPLKERSYYKKRSRKNKGLEKSSQGAVLPVKPTPPGKSASDVAKTPTPATPATAATPAAPKEAEKPKPTTQPPAQQKKGGKQRRR